MPQAQAYVVIINEPGVDTYVLPDAARGLERAQELMVFRAEELLDELDAQEVEAGNEPGNFTIRVADDRMSLKITNDSEADVAGEGGSTVAEMNIQAISLVDMFDV